MIIITGTEQELNIIENKSISALCEYYDNSNHCTLESCCIDLQTIKTGLDFVLTHGKYIEITESDLRELNSYNFLN